MLSNGMGSPSLLFPWREGVLGGAWKGVPGESWEGGGGKTFELPGGKGAEGAILA